VGPDEDGTIQAVKSWVVVEMQPKRTTYHHTRRTLARKIAQVQAFRDRTELTSSTVAFLSLKPSTSRAPTGFKMVGLTGRQTLNVRSVPVPGLRSVGMCRHQMQDTYPHLSSYYDDRSLFARSTLGKAVKVSFSYA
jgi:hypothetical protein